MTQLAKNKDVPFKVADLKSYLVENNVHIFKGAMVCINTSGYAVPAADTAGYRFIGVAYEECDNTLEGRSQGGKSVRILIKGIYRVVATNISQTMIGQPMYVVDDATIDDTSTNYVHVGKLVERESAYVAWIDIGQRETAVGSGPDNCLYVSKRGSAGGVGTIHDPFSLPSQALAAVTATKKTIFIDPGEYAEPAMITWPNVNGISLVGTEVCGNVVISNASAAIAVMKISPTFTAATFEAFLENVCIKHENQIGIQIDNANMGRKLLIHLKNVSTEEGVGDSIDIPHTKAGEAVRVYAEGCNEIEGLVDIVCANTDDRFRFTNCTLIGGLTETGAVAGELLLHACVILATALTVNAAMVLTYRASMYRTDAGVYTELSDGFSA